MSKSYKTFENDVFKRSRQLKRQYATMVSTRKEIRYNKRIQCVNTAQKDEITC